MLLLNADLGESWYDRQIGDDAGLMPYLDLCNLACGFHGGDALTMQRTIALALEHGVKIGAHPSFPDRANFGRQVMELPADQLEALLLYQVAALQGMTWAAGAAASLHHLKPHGALYHYANAHPLAAGAVAGVAAKLGIPHLLGPPTGELRRAVDAEGLAFLAEGFADRRYDPSLHLRPRTETDACIDGVAEAVEQALLLARGQVRTTDGSSRELQIATLCLHGDHAGAVERARAIREALDAIPPQ
ncbi:5-oxoprolinase subunit PxpA [Neolewinella sp.]|uniref:5-oxoprolinase subunit PxpA n=1 Tax=Neolewinella sp. TaxID=2993543 RepID=UPI003B51C799